MANLLSLDQASITGWAADIDGRYIHGIWRLTKYKTPDDRLWAFMQHLLAFHKKYPLDYLAYEIPHVGNHANVAEPIYGLVATIRLFCRSRKLPPPVGFTPGQWRSKVYGSKKVFPPKDLKTVEERKAWHVRNAYDLCEDLGLTVERPDEAEAVGILEALKIELGPAHANAHHERRTGQGALL